VDIRIVVSYMTANVACLVCTLIILRRVSHDLGSEMEVRLLRLCLGAFALFLVFDGFYFVAGTAGYVTVTVPALVVGSCLSLFFPELMACAWFGFVSLRIVREEDLEKRIKAAAIVPFLIGLALIATTYWTGLVVSFDSEGISTRGPLFWSELAVVSCYGLGTVWCCVRALRHGAMGERRSEALLMTSACVMPAIATVIDLFFPGSAILAPGFFVSTFLVFTHLRSNCVYTDALTGLNNRKRLEQFYSGNNSVMDERGQAMLFIVDLDKFKHINDTYGHLAGDKALVAAARAIGRCAGAHHGFAARYGGDEFVMLCSVEAAGDPWMVNPELQGYLDEVLEARGFEFPVSLSVGYARIDMRREKLGAAIKHADTMLYQVKEKHHKEMESA